jgi:hypothetical protein
MEFITSPVRLYQKRWIRKLLRGSWIKYQNDWHPVRVVKLSADERGTYYLTSSGLLNSLHTGIQAKEISN